MIQREGNLPIGWFTPHIGSMGQAEMTPKPGTWNWICVTNIGVGAQALLLLSQAHQHGVESRVGQLGLKPILIWDS